MSKFIVVGEVRGVHGLKGFFKITSFTENPDNICLLYTSDAADE